MDQARIEFLLDDGWVLVNRLHQWLAAFPQGLNDRNALAELIGGLQRLWSVADDLRLKRLARVTLGLEQLFERLCARNLDFSTEEMQNVITSNVSGLQGMLLELEATREEPEILELNSLARLERFVLQPVRHHSEPVTSLIETSSLHFDDSQTTTISFETAVGLSDDERSVVIAETCDRPHVDQAWLELLEQFVVQIDATCHRLHERMVADELPYATTTSRLEHLAATTRELVERVVFRPQLDLAAPMLDRMETAVSLMIPEHSLPQLMTVEVISEVNRVGNESTFDTIVAPATLIGSTDETSVDGAPLVTPNLQELVKIQLAPRRVLVVEESLFYRHLICLAAQSASYETHAVESIEQGVSALEQSSNFQAILIGSAITPEMAQAIEQHRQSHGLKVIGLKGSEQTQLAADGVDDQVARSQPHQLISVLDRLLEDSSSDKRLSTEHSRATQ